MRSAIRPTRVQLPSRSATLRVCRTSKEAAVLKLAVALPVALLAVAAGAGCAATDEGEAIIEGVLVLDGPDCSVSVADNFAPTALLDIGIDAGSANNLILPVKVRTNLPSTFSSTNLTQDQGRSPNFPNYGNNDANIITFNQSEVFFSTDEDRGNQLQLGNVAGTPVNRDNERLTGVGAVAFNEQTQLLSPTIVFTTAITKGDATFLQGEPFVNAAVAAGATAHIILNIRLVGSTTGGARIETPVFPFPVDLCAGCLASPNVIPVCNDDKGTADPADDVAVAPVPNPAVCVQGNNFRSFVCP